MTKEEILDALKAVKYPPYNKDIVSFGMVKYVKIDGKKAEIKIFTGGAEDTAKKVGRRDRSRRHKLHRKLGRQILSRNAAYL